MHVQGESLKTLASSPLGGFSNSPITRCAGVQRSLQKKHQRPLRKRTGRWHPIFCRVRPGKHRPGESLSGKPEGLFLWFDFSLLHQIFEKKWRSFRSQCQVYLTPSHICRTSLMGAGSRPD